MRKLGKRITQKGSDKRTQKNTLELVTELTSRNTKEFAKKHKTDRGERKTTFKAIAKATGVSTTQLRKYRLYYEDPENKKSLKPPKKFENRLKKFSTKKGATLTRTKGLIFLRENTDSFKNLVTPSSFAEIKRQQAEKSFNGIFIRVHILFITNTGSYLTWISIIPDVILLSSLKRLNDFITEEIKKKIRAKNSIRGFEIIETIIDITEKEYITIEPELKNTKQIKKGKKPR